ncbi:MAG: Hsp20/alpha crystallin family protein [Humidesulfovibrio sp.]|uniref:Hsp20/alpha crystallin family protein n=1 Tax=Humidesulfovibrio sp. TaxID=2910988 RepID=UPI0027F620A9|nr:Hsp20/alpha crystallin family protein [Humidesulfovibrio sp.]MDQ7835093.1 Hsp20/alpha crystallin family protein [Humidesulfovibrio sp.]
MLKEWLPSLRRRSEEALRPVSIADMMEDFWRKPFGLSPFMEDFQKNFFGGKAAYPVVNVSETEKEIRVDAELPGMEAKDVDVCLENGTLLIKGEKKFEGEEKKDNYHRIERSYGSFSRAVPLPSKVNPKGIKAKFEKGVLHVTLPKAEPSPPAQKIKIEG